MPDEAINLLPKQHDFVTCEAREVLYSGAFGSGKSRATCVKLAMRASRPGAREGLVRKHLVTLKATTLKTLLEPEGSLPPVLPEGSYTHNRSEKEIRIHGGGQIVYFGLDDERKIGSRNLSGVAIDQSEELAEADYTALRGRVRLIVEGIAGQIYSACNPDSPEHYLAKRFGLTVEHPTPQANCVAFRTKSSDNPFLPAAYQNDLATFTGLAKRRFVDGEWCGADGLIYDAFDRQLFVHERVGPWKQVVAGVDWGFTHPSAIIVLCQDETGTAYHVAAEFYKSGCTPADIVAAAGRLRNEWGISEFVVDPSAPAVREEMSRAGLSAYAADNDVNAGILRVSQRLVIDGAGKPAITVSPTCKNLISEFQTYEWAPTSSPTGKERPVKENDDALDALRYAVMRLTKGGLVVRVINYGGGPRKLPGVSDAGWTTVWEQDQFSR